MSLTVGLVGTAQATVTAENTAAAVGSGLLPVYATPSMVALMEGAAVNALKGHLDEGQGSVGIALDLTHDAATPVGMTVRAEAVLTAVDGRKLTFEVKAFDDAGQIGSGVHQRFVIDNERFMAKAAKRGEG